MEEIDIDGREARAMARNSVMEPERQVAILAMLEITRGTPLSRSQKILKT